MEVRLVSERGPPPSLKDFERFCVFSPRLQFAIQRLRAISWSLSAEMWERGVICYCDAKLITIATSILSLKHQPLLKYCHCELSVLQTDCRVNHVKWRCVSTWLIYPPLPCMQVKSCCWPGFDYSNPTSHNPASHNPVSLDPNPTSHNSVSYNPASRIQPLMTHNQRTSFPFAYLLLVPPSWFHLKFSALLS